jgi:hypothetical protein
MPVFQDADQLHGVIDTLEQRKVRYVVMVGGFVRGRTKDPIINYVREHYRCGPYGVCVRKPDPPAPAADPAASGMSPGAG